VYFRSTGGSVGEILRKLTFFT